MATEKQLQIALTIGLLVAILGYHISGLFISSTFSSATSDLFSVYKIVQIGSAAALYFLVIYNHFLVKFIFRSQYIAGKYKGASGPYEENGNAKINPNDFNIEEFIITQDIFGTTIAGKSFFAGSGELVSTWHGKLFKVEGESYYFGLDVSYRYIEVGVLRLAFAGDKVDGIYYSGKPGSKYAYRLSANKIK